MASRLEYRQPINEIVAPDAVVTDPEFDEGWTVEDANRDKQNIRDIRDRLLTCLHPRHVKSKKQGGANISFIEWHTAHDYMDYATNGHYSTFVKSVQEADNKVVIVMNVTVYAVDGVYQHEDVGFEFLKTVDNKTGEEKEIAYGDAFSNAKAMALKRAMAGFGAARLLYHGNDWTNELRRRKNALQR